MPLTPSLRYCSNKYKLAREGEKGKEKDIYIKKNIYIYIFFLTKSSSVERDEFSVVAWRLDYVFQLSTAVVGLHR